MTRTSLSCFAILMVFSPLGLATEQSTALDPSLSFGRLFTTVPQRQLLDEFGRPASGEIHAPGIDAVANPALALDAEPQQRAAPTAKLSGIVLRSDGRHMVWINGRSELSPGPTDRAVLADTPRTGSIQVPLRDDQGMALLKPGQVWMLKERQIEEGYRVRAAAPDNTSTLESAGDG